MPSTTCTLVRANPTTPFFYETLAFLALMPSPLLAAVNDRSTHTLSPDNLTLTWVETFADQASHTAFVAELLVAWPTFVADRHEYCVANDITLAWSSAA